MRCGVETLLREYPEQKTRVVVLCTPNISTEDVPGLEAEFKPVTMRQMASQKAEALVAPYDADAEFAPTGHRRHRRGQS